MTQEPLVSVIVPTFNRGHLLKRTLLSISAQTNQDFEILIIDDNSTDNTHEVVESFVDCRVRYIKHRENKGQSAARNTGASNARGSYLAFVDSDDVWLPEKLALQLHLVEEHGANIVGTQSIKLDEQNKNIIQQWHPHQLNPDSHELFQNLHINTSSFLISKDTFLLCGGFDESLRNFEDWDLLIRIRDIVYVTKEVLVISYLHQSNSYSQAPLQQRINNLMSIISKHGNVLRAHPQRLKELYISLGVLLLKSSYRFKAFCWFCKALFISPFSRKTYSAIKWILLTIFHIR